MLDQLQDGATVGRPHIADALVAAGVVTDRTQAFDTLLHDGSEFFVGHYYVDAENGRPVGARGRRGPGVRPSRRREARPHRRATPAIRAMAAAGLAGLEVDHRDNPPEARERLRALAAELGLLVTGASDYHGDGKPNRLGENTTDPRACSRRCSGRLSSRRHDVSVASRTTR